MQAKFSPEYVLAASILDRRVTLSSFLDAAVRRPEAQRLGGLVTREESAVPPFGPQGWEHAYAAVEVETTDGEVLRHMADVARGDAGAPQTRSELEAKFRDCLDFSETGWDVDRLLLSLWVPPPQGVLDLVQRDQEMHGPMQAPRTWRDPSRRDCTNGPPACPSLA